MSEATQTLEAPAAPAKVKKAKVAKVKKAKVAKKGKAKATKQVKGNIFDPIYREQYRVHKDHKAPAGGARITCNDDIAKFLLDKTDEQLAKLADRIGISERWAGWQGLNVGMRRMNIGNVLRGMVRRGEYVLAGGEIKKGEAKAKVKKAKATAK